MGNFLNQITTLVKILQEIIIPLWGIYQVGRRIYREYEDDRYADGKEESLTARRKKFEWSQRMTQEYVARKGRVPPDDWTEKTLKKVWKVENPGKTPKSDRDTLLQAMRKDSSLRRPLKSQTRAGKASHVLLVTGPTGDEKGVGS